MDIKEELSKLNKGRADALELVVESTLPGREQVVRVEGGSGGKFIARSDISNEVSESVREAILTWNREYPLMSFRLDDGKLSATIELGTGSSFQTWAEQIRYLARLADRLEYEVSRGQDSF